MVVAIVPSTPAGPADTRSQIVSQFLEATVGRIYTANSNLGENDRCSAESLVEWARAEAAMRPAHEAADLDRAAAILGYRPADWRETDAAVESFVQTGGRDHDAMLAGYFSRQGDDPLAKDVPCNAQSHQNSLPPFPPSRSIL